ncbi:MAG: SDR family NAD(P)-dependent oxidoreductase [Pseudomonadales bacterium]|nr:SDR family NAD(P)-dependent oxidoreductase [Pseudomonadales bacterium]
MALKNNRVVLVTGGSRGVGKGTALALGATGATVYVSGRSSSDGQTTALPGNIHTTTEEITARGGKGIAVICDHTDDKQIAALIEKIISEQGRIDILVNNVYQVPDDMLEWQPFWKRPLDDHWQAMIDLGLRAHYVASYYAAPHMIKQAAGMIVNISSPGARCYLHSVIYGVGKAGKDKMMHDMAKELREYNVAALAIWPGIVKTERLAPAIEADALPEEYEPLKPGMESPEYPGRIIDAIAKADNYMDYSGRSWWNSEVGNELDVQDIDGAQPMSYAPFMGEPGIPPEAMVK